MAHTGRRVVRALVVAVALLAPACGDGDTTDAPDTTTTEPPAETTLPPTTTEPPADTTLPPTTTDPPADTTLPTTTEPPADTTLPPTTTEPPAADTTLPAGEALVNVYWAWEVINPPVCCPEKIGAGARFVPGPAVARGALEAMLAGPNEVEAEIGMLTLIPDGTRLLDLAVADGVATVDLSGEFEESSGSLVERMRVGQVVFTLTQFDNIDRVMFRIDGRDRDELMSHGIPVDEGVTRSSDPDIRPGILIEYPYPGAEVPAQMVIRGESNTFEATVQFAVTAGGGDGVVVTEGFTTATAGNGEWGTFETTIDLGAYPETYLSGPGSVVAFETSPRDGSRINIVEHPIALPTIIFSD